MKVLVPVKRVVDYNVRVFPKADGLDVDLASAKRSLNPFDEIAVEEAVRQKEAGKLQEIVVFSIGPKESAEQLRQALALGADRAVHILTEDKVLPIDVAQIIHQYMQQQEDFDLVIMGKQNIDGDHNQSPQMLATLLQRPLAAFISRLDLQKDYLEADRETDQGSETLRAALPAVVSVDLRLNVPRYASLPNIMKAKSKPLSVFNLADIGFTWRPRQRILQVQIPPKRSKGQVLDSVDSLIDKLKNEAKVI